MKKVMTLCLIHDSEKILLGMKKRGFGAGRWNGFGGKVQEGEGIEEAAKRELMEEIGVKVNDLNKRAVFNFHFPNGDIMEVHVFGSNEFEGVPLESEEMKPQWFRHGEIPFDSMWSDDKHWLPRFLDGKNLEGDFYFDEKDQIKSFDLKEI